jgi:hypothetical protein
MPRLLLHLAAALSLAASASGCGGETTDPGGGVLTLSASVATAPADGSWVTLSVNAKDRFGAVGTGNVDFDFTNGQLYGWEPQRPGSAELEKGAASIKYACPQAENPFCVGGQVVHAIWNGVDAYVAVQFTQVP